MDPEDENEEVPEVAPDPEPTPPPRAPPPDPEPTPEQPAPAATAAPEAPAAPRRVLYEDPDEAGPKRVLYQDPDEGAFTAFAREIGHGVGPAAGGAILGAGTGAVAGAFTANPIGIGAAAIGGAILGGYGTDVAQEAGLRALGAPDDAAIRRANEAAHPWATYSGKALSNIAGGAAGFGRAAISGGARLLGGGIGAAWETGVAINEKKSFKEALPGVLSSAAGGAVFAGDRPWTRGAQRAAVAARPYYTRPPPPPPPPAPPPPVTQPGVKNQAWTGPPQDVPQATGFQQGQLPGIGDVQPSLPLEPPAPRTYAEGRQLQLERAPTIDAEGQYGFSMDAPDPRNVSRGAMPPTSGVANEMAPPPRQGSFPEARPWANEREERPHSLIGQAIMADAEGVQPQRASGINVIQAGQVDPTLKHGMIARTDVEPGAPQRPVPTPQPPGGEPPPRPPAPPIERRGVQNPDWQGAPAPIPRNQQVMVRPPDSTQGVLQEPPVPAGQVRLYRTDPRSTAFTTDRATAERFGPLHHVDVPHGQLAAQFRPGHEPGSFVGHPKLWSTPKYRAMVQPTRGMPTQPTQRRWPPPEPPHGPPPPPAPPPRGGGPGPAGQPPGGPRMADPRLDAAVARAVGAPPSGGTPRGPRRAAPPAPAARGQNEYSTGMQNTHPPHSFGWANWYLNRKGQIAADAHKHGLPPTQFEAYLKDIVNRGPDAGPAPGSPPARPAAAEPPKVDKVAASVQRSRKKSDKVNAREAAREQAPERKPLDVGDWRVDHDLAKRGREYAARKRGQTLAEYDAEMKAVGDSLQGRDPKKEWSAYLDEQAKTPGSKAEEFRALTKKVTAGGTDEQAARHSALYKELHGDWVAQWDKGAKPAAEAPAKPDYAAEAQARHDTARARHESEYAGLTDQQKKFYDASASPKGGYPGLTHDAHMDIARMAKSVKEAQAMANELAKPENIAAVNKARNPELYPDKPKAEPPPAAREPVPHKPQQRQPNKLVKNGTGAWTVHDKSGKNIGAIERDFSTGTWEVRQHGTAPIRNLSYNEARAEAMYLVDREAAPKAAEPLAAAAAKAVRPKKANKKAGEQRTLYDHIREMGGLIPTPEVKEALKDFPNRLHLLRSKEKGGRTIDQVWESVAKGAPEERYINDPGANIEGRQPDTDANEILRMIAGDGGKKHLPLGEVPKGDEARIDAENAAHAERVVDNEKAVDEFLADPDRDLADFQEGDRQRMYDIMDEGVSDPAKAYEQAIKERDAQREFEGDVGPPKEITPPPEKGADNKLQEVIPGAGKDMKTAAQRAADAPLKPTQAQKGSDFGMFADKQSDLMDLVQAKPKEEPKAAANEVPEGFKVFERDGKWITESIEGRWEIASKTQAEAIKEAHDTVKSLEKLKGDKPARASAVEAAAEKHGSLEKATDALEAKLAERVKAIEEGTAKPASFPGLQRLAMTRKDMDAKRAGAKNNKPQVVATDKFGNEAKFTGATVHEAAVLARGAGYKPDQIKLLSGAPYVPPKAAAPAAPTPPAAAPPAGGGSPPPPAAPPPPTGGTPTPPPQGPAGSVAAARASILSHVAKDVPWYKKIPTSKAEAKALWRAFYTQAKNAMDPFDQARKTIERETGQRLSANDDFAQLARLTKGLGGRFKQLMQYGTYDINTGKVNGKGLDEVLKPVNDDPDGFTAYAMSKRVVELEGRGIKTGMNLAEANQVVAADAAKFEPVFRDLHAFQDRVLENMVRSGILSDAAAAKMRQMNKEYVPFYRMLDPNSELGQQLGSGLQTRNPIFRIKGSDKDVFDPITSIIKNTYVFTDLAHRNQVITAMKRANDLMPADKQFMVRDRSSHPIEVQPNEIQKYLDAHGIEGFADDAMTIFRPNAFRPADDKIRLYNKGKAEVYTVPKDIGTAVNALDSQSMGLFLKIAATPASLLRAGAVFSPEFIVRNPLRDLLSAFIQAKHGSIPVYDFAIGLTHILKKSKDFQEWMIAGGANANLVSMDRAMLHTDPLSMRVANKVVNPRQWLKMLQDVSELSENATRMGVYSRARGKGIGQRESAFSSREATLDFARLGASPVARALNSTIPFFNAQVEGVDQAARAFRDNKLGFLTKAGVGITLPSVLLWFKNQGDERVKELPSWQKDLFWIVPGRDNWVPVDQKDAARWEGKDLSKLTHTVRQGPNGLERNDATIWRIPKPFEVGVLFGSVPERLLDAYYDHNPNAFKNLSNTMIQALTPSVVPQAALPGIEQFANRSIFLDRSLETEEMRKKSPAQRYGPYTSETAKTLGHVVRAVAGEKSSFGSPIMIDNYIRQWTGGLGKHVVDIIDAGLKSQQKDRPPAPAQTLADMPGIKAFVARFPSQSAQSIQDFYDTRTDRKMNAADIKGLQKTDPKGAAERKSTADTYTADTFANQLKADRAAIKRIAADKNMSPEDKRAAMDLTYLLMIEHAKAGNAAFERNKRRAP